MSFFGIFTIPPARPSLLGYVYAAMCLLLAPVCMFNARALVPIIALASLCALIVAWRANRLAALRHIDRPFALLLAGYVTAMLLSSAAGSDIGAPLMSVAKFAGIAVMALTLVPLQAGMTSSDRHWVFLALLASVVVCIAWILVDTATNGSISAIAFGLSDTGGMQRSQLQYYGYFWYKSVSALLGVSVLILGIYMRSRPGFIAALALCGFCILGAEMVGSRTAGYGVVIALGAGAVYHLLGRHRLKVLLCGMAAAFLLPLWITASGLSPNDITAHLEPERPGSYSIAYRMHIWDYVTDKIVERPVLGWGAGSSKLLGTDASGKLTDAKFGVLGEPIPLHPHNGVLQVWLEFGAIGAIMAFMLLARILTLADRAAATPARRFWTFSAIALLICFFGFNFSIASSWWLASVVAVASLAATFMPDRDAAALT